jgi:hypothetical protein
VRWACFDAARESSICSEFINVQSSFLELASKLFISTKKIDYDGNNFFLKITQNIPALIRDRSQNKNNKKMRRCFSIETSLLLAWYV